MTNCLVPGCSEAAVVGEDWNDGGLVPLTTHRRGMEMRLAVEDVAVTLALCQAHGRELSEEAWMPMLERLDSWGWEPLGRG